MAQWLGACLGHTQTVKGQGLLSGWGSAWEPQQAQTGAREGPGHWEVVGVSQGTPLPEPA